MDQASRPRPHLCAAKLLATFAYYIGELRGTLRIPKHEQTDMLIWDISAFYKDESVHF
jgi:hypothetical protein